MTRSLRTCLWPALAVILALVACKREDEPDWPYGPPPFETAAPSPATAPSPDAVPLERSAADAGAAPDAGYAFAETADGAGADAVDAEGAPGVDVALSDAAVDGLPDELLVALRRPVSAADRVFAQQETERGRRLHRRMQALEALVHYRAALQRMPTHVLANYLAARAFALVGETDAALTHLRVLAVIDTDSARARLADARAEADLRPLWREAAFREMTGFGTVGVAVPSGTGNARVAAELRRSALVRRLAAAGIVAEVAEPSGPVDADALTIGYRAGHEALAREVAKALDVSSSPRESRDAQAFDVVVTAGLGSVPVPASTSTLETFFDRRLSSRSDWGLRLLLLRSTGFFESEARAKDASEVTRRRGRFSVEGDKLVLTYSETVERYPAGAELPEIETRDGRATLPFVLGGDRQVVVDGVVYRPLVGATE